MVNTKDRDGKSPLMIAVEEGREEVVNILAEMADFKSKDNDGKTVMDVAIEQVDEAL